MCLHLNEQLSFVFLKAMNRVFRKTIKTVIAVIMKEFTKS